MEDHEKSKAELIAELQGLRAELARQSAAATQSKAEVLLQIVPLGIHECDLEGRITFVNPSQEAITGYTAEELVGTFIWGRLPPGPERDALPGYFRQLISDQPAPTSFFAKNVTKDGRVFDARVDWNYVRNAQGEVTGFVSVVSDITPQKEAERELQSARDQLERRVDERTSALQDANEQLAIFKIFAEASTQGFGMSDMDGRVVYANPALAKLLGEPTPEDAYGKPVAVYYGEAYQKLRETEIFPELKRAGTWQGELTMRSLSGELIPVLQTSFTLTDEQGKPFRRGVVVVDLREIKDAQRAVEENLCELQAIYDGMMDGFNILDMERQTPLRVNPALCQMMGYTEQELLKLAADDAHPAEDLPWIRERAEGHAAGRYLRTENVPLLRRDGSVFYADVASNPIRYRNRRCIMTFFHDITKRKRNQEALRQEQDSLRCMLQASDHERELLTREIHVGVAQKISGAKIFFEAIYRDCRNLPEHVRENARAGLKALEDAAAEVRTWLSRTRTPVLNDYGLPFAIADFIDQIEDQPDAPEIFYRCEVDFDRLEPVLENAIFRVIQEAMDNAWTHSQTEWLHVALVQDGEQVMIEVRDEGIGFDENQLPDGSFGLYGIRERVRLFGNELFIDSAPGQGTCIRATFPLVHADSAATSGATGD